MAADRRPRWNRSSAASDRQSLVDHRIGGGPDCTSLARLACSQAPAGKAGAGMPFPCDPPASRAARGSAAV